MNSGKIFISYRREDTSGESGRLKDKLEQVFGQENIFYDVETLEAGLNFDQSISKALNESKILLAMIGPHWLKAIDSEGNPRIKNENDWVRKEIHLALQKNLRVIPILVNGATMPETKDLPEELQELSLKHAQEISSSRWNYDVGELVKTLEKIIPAKKSTDQSNFQTRPEPRRIPPMPQPKSWWAKNYIWVLGSFVGLLVLVGMCIPVENETFPIDTDYSMTEQEMIDARENNPEGTEIYDNLTLKNEESQSQNSSATSISLSGRWMGVNDLGLTYYYDISQNGNSITFKELSYDGSIIGNGKGSINGEFLVLDYTSVFDFTGTITLKISNDSNQLTGQVSVPSQGVSAPMTLNRTN